MANDPLISKAIQYIKEDYYDFAIRDLLLQDGVSSFEVDELIEKAKKAVFEEKINFTAKKYKLLFALNVFLMLATLFYFFSVLPEQIESSSFFYPFLGSLVTCFFGFLSIAFYKSWDLEFLRKHESIHINYSFLIIMLLPGVILHFIIASVFENTAEEILKKNQIEVEGTVISGSETETHYRGNSIKEAKIVVEFETVEGEKIIAYKEVSSYEFDKFYYRQNINLVYSKTNPHNINFLTSDQDMKKFKNSAEKEITPLDLERLIDIEGNVREQLDQMVYGWSYDQHNEAWINERKNIAIKFNTNSVTFMAPNGELAHYFLEKAGYEAINKEGKEDIMTKAFGTGLVYKKGDLMAVIELISTKNGEPPMSMTTIRRMKMN